MNNHFFSIDDDDEGATGGAAAAVQPPSGRGRLGSAGSQSDGLNSSSGGLFPIYEAPQQVFALPPAVDLDSTAGSEWESDFG